MSMRFLRGAADNLPDRFIDFLHFGSQTALDFKAKAAKGKSGKKGRRRVFLKISCRLFVGFLAEGGEGLMGGVVFVELGEIDIQNFLGDISCSKEPSGLEILHHGVRSGGIENSRQVIGFCRIISGQPVGFIIDEKFPIKVVATDGDGIGVLGGGVVQDKPRCSQVLPRQFVLPVQIVFTTYFLILFRARQFPYVFHISEPSGCFKPSLPEKLISGIEPNSLIALVVIFHRHWQRYQGGIMEGEGQNAPGNGRTEQKAAFNFSIQCDAFPGFLGVGLNGGGRFNGDQAVLKIRRRLLIQFNEVKGTGNDGGALPKPLLVGVFNG